MLREREERERDSISDVPFRKRLVGIVQHFLPGLAPVDAAADLGPKFLRALQRSSVRLLVGGALVAMGIHDVICHTETTIIRSTALAKNLPLRLAIAKVISD